MCLSRPTRAEAIHVPTHPSMRQSLMCVCAFLDMEYTAKRDWTRRALKRQPRRVSLGRCRSRSLLAAVRGAESVSTSSWRNVCRGRRPAHPRFCDGRGCPHRDRRAASRRAPDAAALSVASAPPCPSGNRPVGSGTGTRSSASPVRTPAGVADGGRLRMRGRRRGCQARRRRLLYEVRIPHDRARRGRIGCATCSDTSVSFDPRHTRRDERLPEKALKDRLISTRHSVRQRFSRSGGSIAPRAGTIAGMPDTRPAARRQCNKRGCHREAAS
jgi:hypothetical protein